MPGWMKHKLKSGVLGGISVTSDTQMTNTLMTESEEEVKSFLMKVKEESEKASLKFNTQKAKIIASGPTTLWQIDARKNGNSDRLYFLRHQNHCGQRLQP